MATTSTYTFDPLDRVATVTKTGAGAGSESYTHDANGNVIAQSIGGVATSFAYDRNRLLTWASGTTSASYTYDPFGRLESVTSAGKQLERKVYDGFDHVIEHRKVTDAGALATTRYGFDALDRTVSKTTGAGTADATTTEFAYLGLTGQLLEELDAATGAVEARYTYSATGERLGQSRKTSAGVWEDSFYGYNAHSDVETLTKADGSTRSTYGYTAYGSDDTARFTGVDKPSVAEPGAEAYNVYRFNAKRWDAASGEYDMGFRDYNPGLNRFTTRDMYNGALADLNLAADPWNSNRYAFAGGNPINRIETDGHVNEVGVGGFSPLGYTSPEEEQLGEQVTTEVVRLGAKAGTLAATTAGAAVACVGSFGIGCAGALFAAGAANEAAFSLLDGRPVEPARVAVAGALELAVGVLPALAPVAATAAARWFRGFARRSDDATQSANAAATVAHSTDDVLANFRALSRGKQSSVRTVPSADELRGLFESWTTGAERLASRGPKIPDVFRLRDGTVIQWRTTSASGGETIDIFPMDGNPLKVHLDG
ncbi:RHS repeat-associated core domain-containing protein [Intrasporangium sp. DVR]|uniref:RHS repeat-associated core domain-containing protein n=1 Tax=Intrasporangium sp. DVR TaxID=3127867 RepID=UPI0033407F4C